MIFSKRQDKSSVVSKSLVEMKKEGIWGWLLYIGFLLVSIIPFICTVSDCIIRVFFDNMYIRYPVYHSDFPFVFFILIGMVLTLIAMKKSPFMMPQIIKKFYWGFVGSFLFSILLFKINGGQSCVKKMEISWFIFGVITWFIVLFWYINYFYKKSKNGYRLVLLKILIFSIISLLPLPFYRLQWAPSLYTGISYCDDIWDFCSLTSVIFSSDFYLYIYSLFGFIPFLFLFLIIGILLPIVIWKFHWKIPKIIKQFCCWILGGLLYSLLLCKLTIYFG